MHEEKMKDFEEYYAQLPEKKLLLERLMQKAAALPQKVAPGKYAEKLTERMALKEQIDSLVNEISAMETREEESKYLSRASSYLLEYHNASSAGREAPMVPIGQLGQFVVSSKVSERGKICDRYAEACLGRISQDKGDDGAYEAGKSKNKISKSFISEINRQNKLLMCQDCNIQRVLDIKEATAVCTNCGSTIEYQTSETHAEFSEEIEILSPFAYKRINHFREWLNQLQAKESTVTSQEVIDLLLLELKKDRITDIADITQKRIKGYLKKLKLNKQYEHTPALINKLCGISPPVISKKLEAKLVSMFEKIQKPFEKYCPSDRKNFLSYSYTLHKMCQLLGENELLPYFPLLKSREKLYLQDRIWKNICNDMKWQFIPSL
jgi:transcription elongation factor Elf1